MKDKIINDIDSNRKKGEKMKNLLPLGTVIALQKGEKKLMIFGRMLLRAEENKTWDYVGCMYPEGNINPQHNYLFNHEDIEKVFFIGFQDTEEINYKTGLNEKINRLKSSQEELKVL